MYDPLMYGLMAASGVIALIAAVQVAMDRPVGSLLLSSILALEVGLLVQLVVGAVTFTRSGEGVNGLTFLGYLIGVLLVPPAGALWAVGERSRAGTAVLIGVGVLVPFLLLRAWQIWNVGA